MPKSEGEYSLDKIGVTKKPSNCPNNVAEAEL